jgi:hypothetical protein
MTTATKSDSVSCMLQVCFVSSEDCVSAISKRMARLRLEHVAKFLEVVLQRPLISVKRDAANIDGGNLQPTRGRSYNRQEYIVLCWYSAQWEASIQPSRIARPHAGSRGLGRGTWVALVPRDSEKHMKTPDVAWCCAKADTGVQSSLPGHRPCRECMICHGRQNDCSCRGQENSAPVRVTDSGQRDWRSCLRTQV